MNLKDLANAYANLDNQINKAFIEHKPDAVTTEMHQDDLLLRKTIADIYKDIYAKLELEYSSMLEVYDTLPELIAKEENPDKKYYHLHLRNDIERAIIKAFMESQGYIYTNDHYWIKNN